MNSYNSVLADIGNRICQRREMLGMSGTELALRADISASTLSKIENGRRNIGVETLCAVAKALEVPLSFLQPKELDKRGKAAPGLKAVETLGIRLRRFASLPHTDAKL